FSQGLRIDLIGFDLGVTDGPGIFEWANVSWISLSWHQSLNQYQKLVHSTTAWTGSSNVLKKSSSARLELGNFASRTTLFLSLIATITILFECKSIPECIMRSSLY